MKLFALLPLRSTLFGLALMSLPACQHQLAGDQQAKLARTVIAMSALRGTQNTVTPIQACSHTGFLGFRFNQYTTFKQFRQSNTVSRTKLILIPKTRIVYRQFRIQQIGIKSSTKTIYFVSARYYATNYHTLVRRLKHEVKRIKSSHPDLKQTQFDFIGSKYKKVGPNRYQKRKLLPKKITLAANGKTNLSRKSKQKLFSFYRFNNKLITATLSTGNDKIQGKLYYVLEYTCTVKQAE